MSKEAIKLALDEFKHIKQWCLRSIGIGLVNEKVLASLEEALAKQEHVEPFAWAEFDGEGGYHFRAYENNEDYAEQWDKRNPNHVGWVKPLYDTPQQRTWVSLTDEEQTRLFTDWDEDQGWGPFIEAIEAKLKEKNA